MRRTLPKKMMFIPLAAGWLLLMKSFAIHVSGVVQDGPDRRPLAGVAVYLLSRKAAPDSQLTDAAGRFRFTESGGCVWGCAVVAIKDGYPPIRSGTFSLRPGGRVEMDLEMPRARR